MAAPRGGVGGVRPWPPGGRGVVRGEHTRGWTGSRGFRTFQQHVLRCIGHAALHVLRTRRARIDMRAMATGRSAEMLRCAPCPSARCAPSSVSHDPSFHKTARRRPRTSSAASLPARRRIAPSRPTARRKCIASRRAPARARRSIARQGSKSSLLQTTCPVGSLLASAGAHKCRTRV